MTGEYGQPEQVLPAAANLAATDATPETETPNIEALLEESASLFEQIETYWARVSELRERLEEVGNTPQFPSEAHVTEDGVRHVQIAKLEHGGRDMRRDVESHRVNTRLMAAKINKRTYVTVGTAHEFFDRACARFRFDGPGVAEFIEVFMQHTEEAAAQIRAESPPRRKRNIEMHGEGVEQLYAASDSLEEAYYYAFIAQYIGAKRIESLLADDVMVVPFIERLHELTAMGQHGSPEFPGLLETLAAHIAQTRIDSGSNYLREALKRTAEQSHTVEQFVTRLLVHNEVAAGRKQSKEFLAGVAAAQALASIISLDETSGFTQADIAARVAAHFADMPADWKTEYSAAVTAQTAKTWAELSTLLKPYERRGRLLSNMREKPAGQAPTGQRAGRPTRRGQAQASAPPPQEATRDVADITEKRVAEPISSFAILKGTGTSSGARYGLEPVAGGLDELMQSQAVTRFLRNNQGLEADLRSFLEQIAGDPYHNPGVGVVHQIKKFRVDGTGVLDQPYPVRRFSPRQSAGEGLSHPLANRVRIFFGICIVNGIKSLAIKDIDLRDDQTYK